MVAVPVFAQAVGSLGGMIVDGSGAVLPGVTVTLSSHGIIGGDRATTTDARGAYMFTQLVPGTYAVKADLEGFRSAQQQNITVNADQTSRLDLMLAVGNLSETVIVAAEVPLLDTSSALHQTVMSREILETLPTASDIYSIGRLTPAVTESKLDVGGKQMVAQSTQYVHGSTQDENGIAYDGMSISHYDSGNGGSVSFYLDSFQAEQMNYQTGQTPAEQPVGGVIVNVVTKTGTNVMHGDGMYNWTTQALQSDNVPPALRAQLLAGVPAAALKANPNITPAPRIDALFDSAFTLSGPVVRDRLWYFGELKYGKSNIYQIGSYNSDGTQLLSDNTLRGYLGKLSWAIGKNSQVHYYITRQLKGRYHVAGGPTVTQFFETQSANYNPSFNMINVGKWTTVLSNHMVLDVSANSMNGQDDSFPEPQVPSNAIARYDTVTRTFTVAQGTYSNPHNGWVNEFAGNLSYTIPGHEFKFGYQLFRDRYHVGSISTSNILANYANGVPTSVNTYNTNLLDTSFWPVLRSRDHALYAQDKWSPTQKLTFNLGLRFQNGNSWVDVDPGSPGYDTATPLCQVATPFIAAQCFANPSGIPHWNNFAPRFSAIYDVSGKGKTVLKFTANRYEIPQGNTMAGRVNPLKVVNDTRPWTVCKPGQTSGCDLNGDGIPQLNELGPSTGYALGTTNRYAPDVAQPYANEIAATFQQQLRGAIVVEAGYFCRVHRNTIGFANAAVPTSSYIPLVVTEVSSGRQVTVYNQDPTTLGKIDNLYSNRPDLDSSYNGVDLSATRRMSNHWMLLGSMSIGRNTGDVYGGTEDLNNPNFTFRHGLLTNDRQVFVKLSGAYELPYRFTVAANAQYYSGYPELTTVLVNSQTVKLTQVSQSIVVQPSGMIRQPGATIVDMNLLRSIKAGRVRVSPRVDVFNILNASGIQSYISQLGPSYGNAITILDGRLVKFGLNVNW
jgi:outer membrane receptor protein involved in Fe transport